MKTYLLDVLIGEVKFCESLLFNDMSVLQEISNKLAEEFPIKNYFKDKNTLLLLNKDKNIRIELSNNRCSLQYEEVENYNKFYKLYGKVIKIITGELKIGMFNRIAIRTLKGVNVDSRNEAVSYIEKNYINNKDKLASIGEIDNCKVDLSFGYKDYKIHLIIAPAVHQVLQVKNGIVEKDINYQQILFDTDIAQYNFNPEDITKFFEENKNINKNVIDKNFNLQGDKNEQ